MAPITRSAGLARHVRRSVAWHRFKEYVNGALWVLPTAAALLALGAGYLMSQVTHDPESVVDMLAFQGTGDDARALLITVSSTVVTVIALVLGLTVVALQLSSTQFSPRLLRNFLRDRATQVVLSAFTATFVYSAAGLFTVGLEDGTRTEEFPRLAISGSILLLFVSLGFVVYFADHLAHSIQIDAINRRIERNTRRTIVQESAARVEEVMPRAPEWAVPLVGRRSGYIQSVYPELLLPLAAEADVTIALRHRVGQHVVAGTVIAWVWTRSPDEPRPSAAEFEESVLQDISVGFERTIEQDIGFGIRQQTDIACKALSAAINDPYTAVQAIEHLSVVYCDLAVLPLGAKVLDGSGGRGRVVVPGSTFSDYMEFITDVLGRYGANDVSVMLAFVRLLRNCAEVLPPGSERLDLLDAAAASAVGDVERAMPRPTDVDRVRAAVAALRRTIAARREREVVRTTPRSVS
jgi:uncharacterized membrane protein